MSDERGVLRQISWRDLCPWLLIYRAAGLALRVELLLLAAAGVWLTVGCWWAAGWIVFAGSPPQSPPPLAADSETTAEAWRNEQAFAAAYQQLTAFPSRKVLNLPSLDTAGAPAAFVQHTMLAGREPFSYVWRRLTGAAVSLFDSDLNGRQFLFLAVGGLATLLVWAWIGGAITRIAAMHLGREERLGARRALGFAAGKLVSNTAAPLLPLGAVAAFALATALCVGLPMQWLGGIGLLWGGAAWVLVLLIGSLAIVLALGLLFGWPLMWPTISSEGTDAFDALSRSYAYTFQRPLHYLFYAVVAGAIGGLTWLLALGFGEAVIELGYWSLSWTVEDDRLVAIRAAAEGAVPEDAAADGSSTGNGALGTIGLRAMALFNGAVRSATYSFAFAYFWTAATAIYLLLRQDVDRTELDEVHPDDDSDAYGIPPLKEAGAAGTADSPPADQPAAGADTDSQQDSNEASQTPAADGDPPTTN